MHNKKSSPLLSLRKRPQAHCTLNNQLQSSTKIRKIDKKLIAECTPTLLANNLAAWPWLWSTRVVASPTTIPMPTTRLLPHTVIWSDMHIQTWNPSSLGGHLIAPQPIYTCGPTHQSTGY